MDAQKTKKATYNKALLALAATFSMSWPVSSRLFRGRPIFLKSQSL
jgi:hypothetical protein